MVRLVGARIHKHTQPNTRTHAYTKKQKHIHTQGHSDTQTDRHTNRQTHTQKTHTHSRTLRHTNRHKMTEKKYKDKNVVLRLMCNEVNQCTIRAVLRLLGTHSHQNTDRLRHTHTHTHKDTQTHIHTQGHSDTNTHTQNDRKTYKDKIVAMTLINVPLRQW